MMAVVIECSAVLSGQQVEDGKFYWELYVSCYLLLVWDL